MKVLKFGGTSVGTPENMHQVYQIISRDNLPKIIVLSALSGVTNTLVKIGDLLLESSSNPEVTETIKSLQTRHETFIEALFKEKEFKKKAQDVLQKHIGQIESLMNVEFSDEQIKILLAQGELISTGIFSHYLEENGRANTLLPALEFMAIDEFDEPDVDYIKRELSQRMNSVSGGDLYVTQGYICLNAKGKVDNLKRGGSDYTASLVGAAINAQVVEIWTDIDGMHNNDPRIVENTYPISELSFNEASELAYFGAKILHPSSILPASKYNIPVRLKNTMQPEAPGTLISSNEKSSEAKAIAAKDGIIAIKIKSSRMLLAYGFLKKVFEVFEEFRTPIDMITTSEVAVSLTIDNDSRLSEIKKALEPFGDVTIDTDQTIVCIVGNRIVEKPGIISMIFSALEDIHVRMISYGGSKYNVSLLIDSDHKEKALNLLTKKLFNATG